MNANTNNNGSTPRTDLDRRDFYIAKARSLRSATIRSMAQAALAHLRGSLRSPAHGRHRAAHVAA